MREVIELHWLGYCLEAMLVVIWVHTFIQIRRLHGTGDKVEKRHLRILRTVKKGDSVLLFIIFVTLSLTEHMIGALLTASVGANIGVIWGSLFAFIQRDRFKEAIQHPVEVRGSKSAITSANTPPPK